jgi:hypothetical protein
MTLALPPIRVFAVLRETPGRSTRKPLLPICSSIRPRDLDARWDERFRCWTVSRLTTAKATLRRFTGDSVPGTTRKADDRFHLATPADAVTLGHLSSHDPSASPLAQAGIGTGAAAGGQLEAEVVHSPLAEGRRPDRFDSDWRGRAESALGPSPLWHDRGATLQSVVA